MRYALLSVFDKHGIEDFAKGLAELGFSLLSTGGTARTLERVGLSVIPVSNLTGFPEILDGRVKTLHPLIFGGILARRSRADDRKTMEEHDLPDIRVVAVNLYPFARKAREGLEEDDLLEFIDIGGPSMIRAAAKNYRDVFVVVDPRDYPRVLDALRDGDDALELRRELALKAFVHTAVYDATIYTELYRRKHGDPPEYLIPVYRRMHTLRYGENPHQRGWAYEALSHGFLSTLQPLWGKALSFNNYVDLYAALALLQDLGEEKPACVIVKHTNPCGTARGDTPLMAYERALAGDPVSAFGGIVALNRPVDRALAEKLNEHFLEIVAAPDFQDEAWEVLTRKKNRRLVRFRFPLPAGYDARLIGGDLLLQEPDLGVWKEEELAVVAGDIPPELWEDLRFAFTVVKHVKSNAIVVARDAQVLGVGAGQMNRVQAVRIALTQAGEKAQGAVLASDAFFPFPDSVEEAAHAGIRAIIQPGGSVRDEAVIARARELGVAMVLTGIRHFRHA